MLTARDVHQLRGHLIHLENVAAAKGSQHAHHRKKSCQRQTGRLHASLCKTFSQVIHRTAVYAARRIKLAILYPQCAFGEFRRHADEATQKKPERDTGSAILNADRHTCDVAETDRARHRRAQSLEMRDLTRIRCTAVFPPHRSQCQRK